MGLITSTREKFKKGPASGMDNKLSETSVLEALKVVQDPDLHKDIVTLGFIKNLAISDSLIKFDVNLTTPACPMKERIKKDCLKALADIAGERNVEITMTAVNTHSRATNAQLEASLGRVKNIIAIASGKGGVGKSTTTTNLAYALKTLGAKVGILDADIYGPSIPLMTRPQNPTHGHNNMLIPPIVNEVKIISMGLFTQEGKATILRGPMAGNVIRQFLMQVEWGELDYLLIDYPPGTGDIQLTISQTAPLSAAIMVTTPQEMALIDVRKAVQMFQTLNVPILGVIETMSYFVCDGCEKKHYIFRARGGEKLSQEFGLPIMGRIPLDQALVQASDEGKPAVLYSSDSAGAKSYTECAGQVASQLSILSNRDQKAQTNFHITWQKKS